MPACEARKGECLTYSVLYKQGGSAHSTPTKRRAEAAADGSTPTKAAKPADSAGGPARAAAEAGPQSAAAEPRSPSRPDVSAEVAEAAAALVSASSGGLQSPRGEPFKGLLSPRRKSDTSAFSSFMSPLRKPGGCPMLIPCLVFSILIYLGRLYLELVVDIARLTLGASCREALLQVE